MFDPDPSPGRSRRTRWLRWIAFALVGGVLLVCLFLAALPSLLSSDAFRQGLEREASRHLGRPVRMDTLELGWGGRFHLGGLRVEDDPAFATDPLLALDQLVIQVDTAGLLRRRAELSVQLKGLDLNVVRDRAGRTNLEALLQHLVPPAPPAPREPTAAEPTAPKPGAGLALPFRELDLTVRLDQLNLRVDDRSQGRSGALRDLSLHLDVHPPQYPITTGINTRIWVDGKEVGPLRLAVTAEQLLAPGGTLDPTKALLSVEATVPGGRLSAHGGLGEAPETAGDPVPGLSATAALELEELWSAALPFLPPELAGSEVGGSLKLDLRGSGDPAETLAFTVGLTASGLRAGGAVLAGRRAGPANLSLQHRGRYHASHGVLEIDDGRIDLQGGTHLAWRGQMAGLDGPDPRAQLEVGPVTLDLAELHSLAQPFLPPGAALRWTGSAPPELRLERLSVTGPLTADVASDQAVELAGLVLEVPGASAMTGTTRMELRGARLLLDAVSTRLRSGFPTAFSLQGSLAVKALNLAGADPLQLRELSLSPLQLTARDLRPAAAGNLPLAGHLELSQGLSLGRIGVGPRTSLEDLRQHLAVAGDLTDRGRLQLRVERFGVQANALAHATGDPQSPSLRLGLGAGERPGLDLAVADLRLSATESLEPDSVDLAAAALTLGPLEAGAGESRVALATATLRTEGLAVALEGGFPRELTVGLSGTVDDLRLDGPDPVQLSRLELPDLSLTARGLAPAAESLFGVAGTFRIEQSLRARDLQVPGTAAVGSLHQELTLEGVLDPGAKARFGVPALAVTLHAAQVDTPEGPVTLPLTLRSRLDSVVLGGTAPEAVDVQGLSLQLDAAPLLALAVDVDAGALGARALRTSGTVRMDASALSRALPAAYRAGGTFTGTAGLEWSLAGRLPSPAEHAALEAPDPALWAAALPLPFLETLELQLRLAGVGADLPLANGERLSVGGIFTTPALRFAVGPGGGSAAFSVPLEARWLEALPGLPPLENPLRLRLAVHGDLGADGSLALRQELGVQPLGIEQEARLTLSGLRPLLAQGLDTPPALWLNVLAGEAEASLRVGRNPDLAGLARAGLRVQGPLRASAGATLTRGEEAAAWLHFEADDASVQLGDRLTVEGLDGSIRLDKRVRLGILRGEVATARAPGYLSEEILSEAGGRRRLRPAAVSSGAATQGGGLRVARLRLAAQPVSMQLDGVELQLDLPGGLPAVERLQVELLGGTVLGSLAFVPADPGYAVDGGLAFTGLSTERLVPGTAGTAPEEAEVSGQLGFRVPLAWEFHQLLSDLELQFRLTQVGPRTLGGALYALDPGESNEAILAQRRLVRLGSPRWAATEVRNGNFSLAGEVEVLGAVLSLPAVERVPVADLPGMLRLESLAEPIATLNCLLDVFAASRLEINPSGEVRFTSDPEETLP